MSFQRNRKTRFTRKPYDADFEKSCRFVRNRCRRCYDEIFPSTLLSRRIGTYRMKYVFAREKKRSDLYANINKKTGDIL